MLVLYITRLASNKIHREVGRAKDLSAPVYTDHAIPYRSVVVIQRNNRCCENRTSCVCTQFWAKFGVSTGSSYIIVCRKNLIVM